MFGIDAGVSGLVSRRQIKREQKFNEAQAAIDRDFQADQAQINRDFQAQQSATAHQRATLDLEKAGLNRILSLGQPASTSAGAMASGSRASHSSGVNVASAMQAANNMKHQNDLLKEQTRKTSAEADKAEFTRFPYKWLNEQMSGDSSTAKHAVEKGRQMKKRIGEVFQDFKDFGTLQKTRMESLKQKAYSNHQLRDRGKSPITTIHLTQPKGK